MKNTKKHIKLVERVSANNYHPLPVVIAKAQGAWVVDVDGKKYIDMLSAYSAVNQGHRHPRIIAAMKKQCERVTLTSRAFHNDVMGKFLDKLTKLTGFDRALPMNTGAEAVETAIKAARKWGYLKKGISKNKANIIVCSGNFHGRTSTIVSFSTDETCRYGYGPYMSGFKIIPYNDPKALEKAINKNTCAFLVEPIQGEAGVIVPDKGYLKKCREITRKKDVLLILDEIQTGLGRTGKLFCYQHEKIRPDIVCIGKALGGGVYPVSAIIANDHIMSVFTPGTHGSTFGGNPLASAVAMASLDVIIDEKLPERAERLGRIFRDQLKRVKSKIIKDVRGMGLLNAIELKVKARPYSHKLMEMGLLAKETHERIIRFAPPLVIAEKELELAIDIISKVFEELG